MRHDTFLAIVGLLGAPLVQGVGDNNSGSFSKPSPQVRPRFRYWLPDASVDAGVVVEDIASAASIGAGGVELVAFYEYGGQLGSMPMGANWSTYNFGTPAFNQLLKRALQAHKEHGMVMDFALGPNQGQGVPAKSNDEGLQWDMIPSTAAIPPSGSYSGVIPGWGTGDLVSLVSALVKSNETMTYQVTGSVGLQNITYEEYQLASGTLIEHTSLVKKTGSVRLSFPKARGSHYRLFAFYEKLSGHKNLIFDSDKHTTIFDNGSYSVDHFSAKGAAVVQKFWENYILKDGVPELLAEVGNYAWEDSLELTFNVTWSQSLPALFKQMTGYSIEPFLPLISFQQNTLAVQGTEPGSFKCILDTDDEGIGYINDFRAALVEGYKQYLTAMADWVHKVLGVQLSVQPAYGSVMDMLSAIPAVDAPECESLSFQDNIDSYRSFTGPSRLADKRVISNEMGAVRSAGFRYHLPELIFSVNRAFIGGINQNVLHGQTFSGEYFATTWPGFVPFNYLFSDPFSPKMPIWSHGLHDAMNYIARVQHVLQTGVAKADVVIYNKESATTIRTIYQAGDLLSESWSWNYLSADNLRLHQAKVKDGVLAPNGPAWKAFIVEGTQNVTLEAVTNLLSFAERGLPVILSGGSPQYYVAGDGSDRARFEKQLAKLLHNKNVYSVASGQVSKKLKSLGLRPQVAVSTNGTCYTSWSQADEVGYALIYSDLVSSTGHITVVTTDTPFYLNPWSGEISPVLIYKRTATTITIPFNLARNQTMLLAFGEKLRQTTKVPRYHVEDAPSHILGGETTNNRGISLHIGRSELSSEVVLSTGKRVQLNANSIPPAFQLSKWNLTAEHWEAPNDLLDNKHIVKHNTSHRLDAPTSWSKVPPLMNATGIGYYTTSFQWPPKAIHSYGKSLGAYIYFSKVMDTITVAINGREISALDITHAIADISPYLQNGQNTISVTVPTTMWNYIRTVLSDLLTAGSVPLPIVLEQFGYPLEPRTDAGLVGSVTIVPYEAVLV